MQENTVRKYKLFWMWQDREEENWLREMAKQGFHLASLVFSGVYEFARGEPRDDVYRLDYTAVDKEEFDDYIEIFRESDWEYIDGGFGWYYFRKPADSESPNEIYTDPESKIKKYQRMFYALVVFPIVLTFFLPQIAKSDSIPLINVLLIAVLLFFVYAIGNILNRIRQLKRL